MPEVAHETKAWKQATHWFSNCEVKPHAAQESRHGLANSKLAFAHFARSARLSAVAGERSQIEVTYDFCAAVQLCAQAARRAAI